MLGAGDAFMAGFLRGWLKDEPLDALLRLGQRLRRPGRVAPRLRAGDGELGRSCSTSSQHGSPTRRLREDALLEHLHRATTRTTALG